MKRLFQTIILFFFITQVFGQNFNEVFESLSVNDRFSNMMNLQHYQSVNPEHAVTYFLLAEIYEQYMRETDPITMFDYLNSNYRQVITYLSLVDGKLDERQARKDRDYYVGVDLVSDNRKIGLEDILLETEKRRLAAIEYFEYATTVNLGYINFANMYNACLYKYRQIADSYPNYKTLYLLTTSSLRCEIEKICSDFDSSLVYFNRYQESCKKLSHIMHVNNYVLKPITTYRLEGLVESDFTAKIVELWDFKSWANNYLAILDCDISQIRNGLINVDKQQNQQIEQFKNNAIYSDEHEYFTPDYKFQNLIAKYDPVSLANQIVDYKNEKIMFLHNTRLSINNINDTTSFFLINKLRYFNNLAEQKQTLNEQVEKLKQSVSLNEVAKYIDFIGQNFNGMDGFVRWCEVEKYDNDLIFNNNLNNLIAFINKNTQSYMFDGEMLRFRNINIPFGIVVLDTVNKYSIINHGVLRNRDGGIYLCGIQEVKNDTLPFLLKTNADKNVEWMKNIPVEPKGSGVTIKKTVLLDNGGVMLCGSIEKIESDSNIISKVFLVHYNSNGDLLKMKYFNSMCEPLSFVVDEIAEQYLLVGRNWNKNSNQNNFSTIKTGLYNFNDTLVWEKNFEMNGDIIDVIVSNADYFLIGNYKQINIDLQGYEINDKQSAIGSLFISRDGENVTFNNYVFEGDVELKYVYKITNKVFNFIGKHRIDDENKEVFYLLLNDNGLPLYTNNTAMNYDSEDF